MKKMNNNTNTMMNNNTIANAVYNAFRKAIMEKGRNLLECMNSEEDTQYIDTELSDANNDTIWWTIGGSEYDYIPYITYNKIYKCLVIWYDGEDCVPVLKKDYEISFDELNRILTMIERALADIDRKNEAFIAWLREEYRKHPFALLNN